MIPTGILTSAPSSISYLLDLYPGATAAYSLRKLKSNYLGKAIRIKRSSDNTETDIGFTGSGNLDTTTLLTFCGSGNGYLTKWYDQSGNSNDAYQATTGYQNLFVNAGTISYVNSKPAIKCNASPSLFLNTPSGILNNTTTFSFYFVINIDNTTGENSGLFGPGQSGYNTGIEILNLSNFGNRTALRLNGTLRNNNSAEAYQLWPDNVQCLTEIYGNSTSVSAYKNNTSITLTNSTATPALNWSLEYSIGSYGGAIAAPVNGYIQELVLYKSNQISNRSGIDSNINSFYTIY